MDSRRDRRRLPENIARRRRGFEDHCQRKVDECELVPVDAFRERFVYLRDRGEITTQGLCWNMGWVSRISDETARKEHRRPGTMRPQTSKAVTTLGLRERRPTGCTHTGRQQHVTYDTALRLCQALGLDPFEAGI